MGPGVCVAAGALLIGAGGLAWGNGAFPDSQSILLPTDRPKAIALATNFGIISTEDDGATWTWSCEQPLSSYGTLYQLGPMPMDRLYAISESGLIRTDDLSCTWSVAGGTAANERLTDLFPDPTNAMRLLLLGIPNTTNTNLPPAAYQSLDAGLTVSAPIYQGALVDTLNGIESARVDPRIVYLASYDGTGPHPRMVKSTDGGMTWTAFNVEPTLGPNSFRIITIDPADAAKVYLLVIEVQSQSLAISTDGGMTYTKPVQFPIALTAFARLASGTILVAGQDVDVASGNLKGVGYRSSDGGKTFTPWAVPNLRALAERDGKLYGAADNFNDGFALGVSTDEGMTFKPLMKYSNVSSIKSCVRQACLDNCYVQAMQGVWPETVCTAASGGSGGGGGCAVQGETAAPRCAMLIVAVSVLSWIRRRNERSCPTQSFVSRICARCRPSAKRKRVDL